MPYTIQYISYPVSKLNSYLLIWSLVKRADYRINGSRAWKKIFELPEESKLQTLIQFIQNLLIHHFPITLSSYTLFFSVRNKIYSY